FSHDLPKAILIVWVIEFIVAFFLMRGKGAEDEGSHPRNRTIPVGMTFSCFHSFLHSMGSPQAARESADPSDRHPGRGHPTPQGFSLPNPITCTRSRPAARTMDRRCRGPAGRRGTECRRTDFLVYLRPSTRRSSGLDTWPWRRRVRRSRGRSTCRPSLRSAA